MAGIHQWCPRLSVALARSLVDSSVWANRSGRSLRRWQSWCPSHGLINRKRLLAVGCLLGGYQLSIIESLYIWGGSFITSPKHLKVDHCPMRLNIVHSNQVDEECLKLRHLSSLSMDNEFQARGRKENADHP